MKLATAGHSFVIALLLGALVVGSYAQGTAQTNLQPFSPSPYKVGERLTYNVSFSSFMSAAHIEMLVAARGTFFGRDGIQLKGHVETIGMVNAALYAINNDYITYVDPSTGLPYYGQQIIRAASRTSETAAEFNQPAGTAALPDKRTVEVAGTYDLLSAVYRVRALPLQEGASYNLSVRGESQTYELEVEVRGRQVIKTNVGSFDTISTRVNVRNNSQANKYQIQVFFSDDQRHVPVLLTAKLSAGEIRVELAGSEFIATPAAPPGATPTPAPVTPVQPGAPSPGDNGALPALPFRVGEQLNYQLFLPSIAQPAGIATFQVRGRSKYFDRDGLFLTLGAQTTNALQHLFFATDVVNSYVDPKTLLPFQTELNLVEGRLRSSTKLKMNQDHGTATTEKGDRIEIPVGTHDYLSFFYALRTFNLAPPRRTAVSILVNNKPKTLFIEALAREPVQIGSQTIPAIKVALTTDDAQADKYQLRVFITDDPRRLPVRITAMTKLGAVRADLAIIPVTNQ
ncbi:MAG: DUF3108 domain-containing protein [Acidobacteriota bacterium]